MPCASIGVLPLGFLNCCIKTRISSAPFVPPMKSASYALDHPFVLNELSSELSPDSSFGLEIALVVVLSTLHPSGRSARLMARARGLVATGLGEVAGSAGRSICVQPTIRVALRARSKVTIEFFRRTVIQPDK